MWVHVGKAVELTVLLVLCCASPNLFAQVPTGAILVTVKDAQGLSISGATVTLTNQGTSRTQSGATSSRGGYEFTDLNVGLYQIEVSKHGFRNSVVTSVNADASTEYSRAPITLGDRSRYGYGDGRRRR